jgi:hypothetical protein
VETQSATSLSVIDLFAENIPACIPAVNRSHYGATLPELSFSGTYIAAFAVIQHLAAMGCHS